MRFLELQTEWIRTSSGRTFQSYSIRASKPNQSDVHSKRNFKFFQSVHPLKLKTERIRDSSEAKFRTFLMRLVKPNESGLHPNESFNRFQSRHTNRMNPSFKQTNLSIVFNPRAQSNFKSNESKQYSDNFSIFFKPSIQTESIGPSLKAKFQTFSFRTFNPNKSEAHPKPTFQTCSICVFEPNESQLHPDKPFNHL